MTRLGVVTGSVAEARCLPPSAAGCVLAVVCSGGDPGRAGDGARRLVDEGAQALLSFGLAGGLDPGLAPGALVIAEAVVSPAGAVHETNGPWRDALAAALASETPVIGRIAGSDRAVASVAAKRALRETSEALAVDMESHRVAAVAAETQAPFAVLRVVADPAGRTLPRAALAGLGPDGEINLGAVLGGLALRPWEAPAMVALALDAWRGLAALSRGVALTGPSLGRGTLG